MQSQVYYWRKAAVQPQTLSEKKSKTLSEKKSAALRSSGGIGRSRSSARGIGPNLVDCHVSGRECRARSTTTGAKQPGGCSIGEVNAAPTAYCLRLG